MSEDKTKKEEYDVFIADSIYPEPTLIFTYEHKSLEEIKDNCYVVLDTNILLAPYKVGEKDLLEQCEGTYKSLIDENRLIVPAQVAREFAKHRAGKLAELYQQLSDKRDESSRHQIGTGQYPLLSPFNEYQEVIQLEREINKKIRDYRGAINKTLNLIQGWHWNDPVSSLYRRIFTENVIRELSLKPEDIRKDLERRHLHHIPPGFKDAAKSDRGIGDLLIWHTILELAREKKASVLFVSGDEKADWFQRTKNTPLYPRYELIDEFRRASGGQSLHIVNFSRFLEIFGATEKVLNEVRQEEISERATRAYNAYKAEKFVVDWIKQNHPGALKTSEESMDVDIRVETSPGHEKGFLILSLSIGYIFTPNIITGYSKYKNLLDLDELFIILVTNEGGTSSTADLLRLYIPKEDSIHYIIGFINDNDQFINTHHL